MKVHIVNLEAEDDHASARDKMSQAQAPKVVLVWPRRGRPLASQLDLQILGRHAFRHGQELGLVTFDPEVSANASRVGLPVFDSLERLPAWEWNQATTFPVRPDRVPLSEQREVRDAGGNAAIVELHGQGRIAVFAIAVAAVIAIALVVIPRAEVVIDPARISVEEVVSLWVDPGMLAPDPQGSADFGELSRGVEPTSASSDFGELSRGVEPTSASSAEPSIGRGQISIPGQVQSVQVSGKQRLDTTGRVSLPQAAAEGEVEFKNLIGELIPIPAGTGVRAGDVRFLTTEDIDLGAGEGSIATAAIVAAEPGRSGNVAAGEIESVEGPLGFLVSASNPEATSGGENQLSDTVSSRDLRQLRSLLEPELLKLAREELIAQLGRGQELIPSSLHVSNVLIEQYDATEGQAVDSLGLLMAVEVEALSFSTPTALAAVEHAISDSIPVGRVLIPNSLSIAASDASQDWPVIEVNFSAEASLAISIDEDQVRREILGGAKDRAGELLAEVFELPEPPYIETSPSWLPWLPWLAMQVDVRWAWESA